MLLPDDLVEREWQGALADAGLDTADVVLWTSTGFEDLRRDTPACCYPPGRDVGPRDPFLPALKRAGVDLEYTARPRVALFLDFGDAEQDSGVPPEALVAGLLRHELEHAKQALFWQRRLDLYELDGFIDHMLENKAQNVGALYNAKPTENDANAAASRYLEREYDAGRHAIHEAGRYCELTRYPSGPEPLESLVPRLVVFGLLVRAQLDAEATRIGESVAELVEYHGAGGTGELWTSLTQVVDGWRAPRAEP